MAYINIHVCAAHTQAFLIRYHDYTAQNFIDNLTQRNTWRKLLLLNWEHSLLRKRTSVFNNYCLLVFVCNNQCFRALKCLLRELVPYVQWSIFLTQNYCDCSRSGQYNERPSIFCAAANVIQLPLEGQQVEELCYFSLMNVIGCIHLSPMVMVG